VQKIVHNTTTMLKLVVASCLAVAAAGQFVDPKNAKILKEQRFNAGDGRFGSAYAQEDGVVFREETGAQGERVGQYSYIGDDGKTYTVKYTAGKDGFRILDGSHVPTGANGLNSAPFAAEETAAVQQVSAAPVRTAVLPQQVVAAATAPKDYDYVDEVNAPVDPNFNPFVNPHDPTHRNFQFNANAARFAPQQSAAVQQFNSAAVPPCADCAGVNPFVNPFDASHQQAGLLAGHQAGQQQQQQVRFVQQQPQQPAALPAFLPTSTEAPRRFFPPGQLQLNRFETGFNFDFASQ
jgi:hypothetical protein